MRTRNQIIKEVTNDYLNGIDTNNVPTPSEIEGEILANVETELSLENASRKAANLSKYQVPMKLMPSQIADILAKLYPIIRISGAGQDADPAYDILAIYQSSGPSIGIYSTDEDILHKLAEQYNYELTEREFDEIIVKLRLKVERKIRTSERDLIPLNNGIFNYATKQLEPFSKDKIFLAKAQVNWPTSPPQMPEFIEPDGNKWNPKAWLEELTDDPSITKLLYQVIGAVLRPFVSWNKSAWLYSETGNNGKGSFCELTRNIIGKGSYVSLPISDFGKDFALEPLIRANAIITDENDVGTYVDKAANLKAIITGDEFAVNRKFKQQITYRFFGFMIQCLNEFPRVKDKSESFYRRQIFIPFNKSFTGREKKYIKDIYLKDKSVLEWFTYQALTMPDYYSLDEPESCRLVLAEYKEYNDPIREFLSEVLPEAKWDLLPFSLLYPMYRTWYQQNNTEKLTLKRKTFVQNVTAIAFTMSDWECKQDPRDKYWRGNKMNGPEPLIAKYNVIEWYNPLYKGTDPDKLCLPQNLAETYRGLCRTSALKAENKD